MEVIQECRWREPHNDAAGHTYTPTHSHTDTLTHLSAATLAFSGLRSTRFIIDIIDTNHWIIGSIIQAMVPRSKWRPPFNTRKANLIWNEVKAIKKRDIFEVLWSMPRNFLLLRPSTFLLLLLLLMLLVLLLFFFLFCGIWWLVLWWTSAWSMATSFLLRLAAKFRWSPAGSSHSSSSVTPERGGREGGEEGEGRCFTISWSVSVIFSTILSGSFQDFYGDSWQLGETS